MKDGWLWLSILKMIACAVADIDDAGILARALDDAGPVVGSVRSQRFDDL